ncbi:MULTISPECIES: AAA family ATPase [Staphylococcus]|uniref:AAA family ATPase n=1 Tax=Staphylococcus TaxID=1279 RepID=UPI00066A2532|nr:AAA family ATPase [Staphylococcus epidermidis]MDH8804051.1 AAA family ATPase [Staphylococcus epidermidis]MDS3971959.1 AAA family ATPase [Staphylococcus epidermidis]MDU4503865.1 AAA family ATPase [Staphylococcus warneri]HAZ6130401.1 ATP-dependent Clp protease ATP-binding subunit [Staphylococcus aureus]
MSYQIKIVMGPKSYLNEFLHQPYITLEDYIIKIDSLTRNLVEKFTDNNYEEILKDKIILAKTESYSGITSAALSNFIQIVNKSIEFGKGIILQNPPKSVINQIKNSFDENQYAFCEYEYPKLDLAVLSNIKERSTEQLFGQVNAIKRILASLYKLTKESRKSIVLMLYGPSGVGKTEMSKIISECLGGKLFRKQMSMNKTNYMFDYIFGNNHGEPSLARDLLERESNIVLLDEFDKGVNEINSAFYQLFDEGIFEDSQYKVTMRNSIIICTSNFKGEAQIRRELGDPIYYRFDDFIEFAELNDEAKKNILTRILSEEFNKLSDNEKSLLPREEILLKQYMIKIKQFTNYRHMKKLVENDINLRLISAMLDF